MLGKNSIAAVLLFAAATAGYSQQRLYPPFTKWYQDPLGFKPVELSTGVGFAWGSLAIAACLLFADKDSSLQKTIFFYEEATSSFGYKPPYTASIHNNTGILFKIRPWMAVGADFNFFHFTDRINNTSGFGIRPFARWYAIKGKKLNMFFEYGAGVSYNANPFPLTGTGLKSDTASTGTRFNFTTKYGIGSEFRVSDRIILQAGVRHFHLSNGGIKGMLRNPSHDSNGIFAGFLYTLFSAPKF